jgi:hypothetical protein
VQVGEDSHGAAVDDVLAEAREVARPGASGVDARGHTAVATVILRIDAERGAAPVDVRVQVDQARRHDQARHVDHFGACIGGKAGADRGNLAASEADVGHGVEVLRRIDDPPPLRMRSMAMVPRAGGGYDGGGTRCPGRGMRRLGLAKFKPQITAAASPGIENRPLVDTV